MKRFHPLVKGLLAAAALIPVAGLFVAATATLSYLSPQVVSTYYDLTNRAPSLTQPFMLVSGAKAAGDFGDPKLFRWDRTSTETASAVALTVPGKATGRYIHAWTDGDVRLFTGAADSTNDHSVQIQAAMVAAAARGVPLYFPKGTWSAANLVASAGSWAQLQLRGEKPFGSKQVIEGNSVLRLKDGAGATASLLTAVSGSPIDIRGLAFDGNRTNNAATTNALIRLEGEGYDETLLEDVAVFHAPADGIYITRDETRLVRFYALYCGGHGLRYYSTTDHQIDYGLLGYNDGDGINAYQLYSSRFDHIDSYQNRGHGAYLEDCRDARWSVIQPQQNWKSGARISCWNMELRGFVPLWNNSDTNYHGPNPAATGTYSEVEVFGSAQNITILGGTLGDSQVRSKLPKYLIDDQRALSYAQAGLGISLIGVNARKDYGFTTARWPAHLDRNSVLSVYDISDGERYISSYGLQRTVAGGYPISVRPSEHLLILTGTNRHAILPSTNSVPDGWEVTVVDANGTADTNNIALSSADGFVFGLGTNRLYDAGGIWTFTKSGVNYGLKSFASPEQMLIGDMSYRWSTRGAPRLVVSAWQERDQAGRPIVLAGYRTNGLVYNFLKFFGAGGNPSAVSGLSSNWPVGGIEWETRSMDGSNVVGTRIYTVPERDPQSTNFPHALIVQSMDGGKTVYTRRSADGAWSIRDDGAADAAGAGVLLELVSTNRGFVPPRLTTAQRTAFVPPKDGILIYDYEANSYYISSDVGTWLPMSGGGGGGGTNGVTDGDKGDITVSASGTTYTIDSGAVTSGKILDGTVATGDLADASVTSAKIVDGTVATADLADSSVTSAKILDGTIATADVADSAVTGPKIAGGTIDTNKLSAAAMAAITFDAEASANYEPLRSTVSQAEAEAGTATTVRGWTAERVKQAIAALAPGGGGSSVIIRTNGETGDPLVRHPDLSVGTTNAMSVSNLTVNGELRLPSAFPVAVGGTGATNPAVALSNLGGQPADAHLSTLASAGSTGSGRFVRETNAEMGSITLGGVKRTSWPSAGTFEYAVDVVVTLTNINTADFVPMWTNAVPSGETHILQTDLGYAGQTNRASFLLRSVLANRGGTGGGFANSVVASQVSDAAAVAHWTNSGTNLILLVRTPSNEPVMVHAWGTLRRITNAGTYGGPPSGYLFYKDFEEVGAPSGTAELTSGGSINYDATSGPLSGSTEHVTIDPTSGAAQLLIQLPSDDGEFTAYFAHKRASVTSTLRRMFQIFDASSNSLAFLQTASGSSGFRGYHGSVSNTVANNFSSLSGVWIHNWVTFVKGSGSNGYLRWLIATNDAASGTTAEVIVSTGTSTADARFIVVGHNSTLSTTFTYDHVATRDGTNSITAPPQAP